MFTATKNPVRVLGSALLVWMASCVFLTMVVFAANCVDCDCYDGTRFLTENEGEDVVGIEGTVTLCKAPAKVNPAGVVNCKTGNYECTAIGETQNLNSILCDSLCTTAQGVDRPAR